MVEKVRDGMVNDRPLISILIPAYYSGVNLNDAIASALKQTYEPLELIISDDGTPNFNAAEVSCFAASLNPTIRCEVLTRKENYGTVANLNSALAHVKGEWVQLLAADDMFASEQSVEQLAESAISTGAPWVLALTKLCSNTMEPTEKTIPSEMERELLYGRNTQALYVRVCQDSILPSSQMIRRDLLAQLGGFDSRYRLVEDWPLALKCLRMGIQPTISEQVCVYHRSGGVSRKSAGHNQDYQKDLIHIMENEVLPYLDSLNEWERERIRRHIADKQSIYRFRFKAKTPVEKFVWCLQNMDLIMRRLNERRTRNDI